MHRSNSLTVMKKTFKYVKNQRCQDHSQREGFRLGLKRLLVIVKTTIVINDYLNWGWSGDLTLTL